MVLRATPVARAVAAMAGAVRLRGHVQSPRPLITRRTNRCEPQRNGFLVDHPTTLSGSWRGENHPTPRGSYRRAYFWASPNTTLALWKHAEKSACGSAGNDKEPQAE